MPTSARTTQDFFECWIHIHVGYWIRVDNLHRVVSSNSLCSETLESLLQNNDCLDSQRLDKLSCPPQQEHSVFFLVPEVNGFAFVSIPIGFIIAPVVEMFVAPFNYVAKRCSAIILPLIHFRRVCISPESEIPSRCRSIRHLILKLCRHRPCFL